MSTPSPSEAQPRQARRRTRASSWEVFNDAGVLIGDVHRAGRQYDAHPLKGYRIGTYSTLSAAARAIRNDPA